MSLFFFFNDTATTELSPPSLHAALPISMFGDTAPRAMLFLVPQLRKNFLPSPSELYISLRDGRKFFRDRKSTHLNSSHQIISYAVFCFKKKKKSALRVPVVAFHHVAVSY